MASVQSVLAAALRPVNASPAVLAWLVPFASIVVGLLAFGVFVGLLGRNPLEVYATIFEGGFASAFSWNNTLLRAAPLILTGLAVAIPAQAGLVVIGGEGALALGATLGCIAIIVRQEIVLVIVGGIFVIETLSVMAQVASFKLTGRRIFRMAPIHHHFELKGWPEPRVIVRFWIISVMLALVALATLKVR